VLKWLHRYRRLGLTLALVTAASLAASAALGGVAAANLIDARSLKGATEPVSLADTTDRLTQDVGNLAQPGLVSLPGGPLPDPGEVAAASLAEVKDLVLRAERDVGRLQQQLADTLARYARDLADLDHVLARLGNAFVPSHLLDVLNRAGSGEEVEVIVTYTHPPTAEDEKRLLETGIRGGVRLSHLPMIAVVGPAKAVRKIAHLPGVLSVWPNDRLEYFMKDSRVLIGVDKVEKDARFHTIWTDGRGVAGSGVKVAVIDSGVDATHPDLPFGTKVIENRKLVGLSIVEDLGLPEITGLQLAVTMPNTDTSSGHGTHVAGTVGGLGTAWPANAGVARDVKLVGLGAGDVLWIFFALEAFDWVIGYNLKNPHDPIRVTTNSWGTSGSTDPGRYLEFLANPIVLATRLLHDQWNVVTLFAAGNAGGYGTINPYSVWPWVISVAAGTKDGQLAGFSSRGLNPQLENDDRFTRELTAGGHRFRLVDILKPDITAPGVDIISARASTSSLGALALTQDLALGSQAVFYSHMSGTSMATPHATGVVAMLLSANPGLTPRQVERVLVETATPMPRYAEYEAGAGYIDAYAAVHRVLAETEKALGLVLPYGRGLERASPVPYGQRVNARGFSYQPLGAEWTETGSYTTGVRNYALFKKPFPAGTSTVKLTSDYAATSSLVVTTSNIWIYRPTDGQRKPRDDEGAGTFTGRGAVMILNNPVTDNGNPDDKSDLYWYNLRGALSVLTGTGGTELPRTFSFRVQPFGFEYANAGFRASVSQLDPADQSLVSKLVAAGAVSEFRPFDAAGPVPRAEFATALFLMKGAKQYAPEVRTYDDVGRDHPAYVAIESLRGQWDFRGQPELPSGVKVEALMTGATQKAGVSVPVIDGVGQTFAPTAAVGRLDFAYTLGRLAGLRARAEALAATYAAKGGLIDERNTPVGTFRTFLADEGITPLEAGYLAAAYEAGWIEWVAFEVLKQPTFEELYNWYVRGIGQKPAYEVAIKLAPFQAMERLPAYRVLAEVTGW